MCLIAFAIGASPRWPLVIAANRDEFLDRPTLPLARWRTDAGTEVISGRDLRAGGTWLGLSPGGRLAMLTNVREAPISTREKSRGELVTRWLEGAMDASEFMAQNEGEAYGPFNLVLGDFQTGAWHWVTNRAAASGWQAQVLGSGIYGLSNGTLDEPWPKTLALKKAMAIALTAPDPDTLQAGLRTALQDRQRTSQDMLPQTGVPLALELALSSAFVDFPEHGYGTRCSTLLVASATSATPAADWDVQLHETTHAPGQPHPFAQSCQLAWQRSPVL